MILGQSIFDAVLDRLKEEAEDAEEDTSHNKVQIRGFNSSFIPTGADAPPPTPEETLKNLYFAYADTDEDPGSFREATNEEAFDPAPFLRLTPEEVAEDLGIEKSDTPAKLLERRRHFARINHPDRVPEDWRGKANMRMKLANLLIDEAIKQHQLQS